MWRRTTALAAAALLCWPASLAAAEPAAAPAIAYETRLAQEPEPAPSPSPAALGMRPPAKDPFTAAVFSAIFPGAGQLYNGQFWPKSALILGGETIGLTAVILGNNTYKAAVAGQKGPDFQNYSFGFYFGLASMVALYIYGIIDAYTSAEEINRRIEKDYGALRPVLSERPLAAADTLGVNWRFEL